MKKISYILALLLGVMAFTSCEDFLDKAPLDTISTEAKLTGTDALALIDAAYQPLQWPKIYNMRIWSTDIIAGNGLVGGDGATDGLETTDLANFNASSTNLAALDLWRGPYPGILRCNIVLKNIPTIDMDAALRNRILGEAYFLRAHYYFILVRVFGDVPLQTEPLAVGSNLNQARTPKDKVYEQIVSDCQKAIELLPVKSSYGSKDLGRACKEAAECMLAKVYLTLGTNYKQVVDLCQAIEDLGYDLSTMNYADNFNPLINNGAESLFEVQYSGSKVYDFWTNDNQACWLSTYMGPRSSDWVGGSWGWDHVNQEFVDAYEPGDLRKDVTILYKGCPQFDGKDYDPSWSTTGYNVRKYLVPKSIASSYDNNPANIVVYRFADVLLMKAEALNELGETGKAQIPLNKVRKRAGLPDVTTTDKEVMKEKIIHERRMELAFEGHRWFDLIRIDNGDYAIKFFKSIGKTNVTKERLLYPIPQDEIDANPNMTQNPGY
ncbi:MAG: RagB/SusD family nutrient uptake outer membrane protein [Bacteroidota bacterium]|nr:RagB/SusD family nutrient uptake outer membrane protein [Bacteroidota bacterium]